MTYTEFKIDWFLQTYGEEVFMIFLFFLEVEYSEYNGVVPTIEQYIEKTIFPTDILAYLAQSDYFSDQRRELYSLWSDETSWPGETLFRLANLETKVDRLLGARGML